MRCSRFLFGDSSASRKDAESRACIIGFYGWHCACGRDESPLRICVSAVALAYAYS